MKFYVVAALALLSGAQAAESVSTTVTCSSCPSHSSTPDMVTRSALPTISCSEKPLTVVTDESWSSSMPSGAAAPTGSMPASTPSPAVPANGASSNKMGTMGGVLVIAAVAASCIL
ncbi:hypothetical protein FSOLCH5_007423 [Fusarium solani]|uniref:Uncharacterized protein n=1 Tax=Fusarium solani TaxID=169388 RepID=A0A9P9HL60_FUSSL|nr:uncharacterized protein B0J15DRAFT_525722 [Fusarium solani]KAH7258474.1 hypothetical protein B0J15DRAFT_525722 [Fusarium solani]KAJ4212608.1 hypothetical protein NW759_011645 [Fusarium solani]